MQECWTLEMIDSIDLQEDKYLSFIGGKPLLPKHMDIPKCKLCDAEQTFFFQVAFPNGHAWSGLTISTFLCTSCADTDHIIPKMLDGPLNNTDIPQKFLDKYQENFGFLVFETNLGEMRLNYSEKVRYRAIYLRPVDDPSTDGNKLGGVPNWILEDESPGSYMAKFNMCFLLQLEVGMQFDVLNHVLPQMEIGLRGNIEPSPNRYYQLFNGNKVFLFGVCDQNCPLVYAITQI